MLEPVLPARTALPRTPPTRAALGIVLVNWNRWVDTIECLESVFRSSIPVRVVVVDNASADGSLDHIAAWAAGTQLAVPVASAMAPLSTPPLPKPIACLRIAAGDIDRLGSNSHHSLTLIDSGGNLGFAGGNNVGLRYLLRDPALRHFWLLNNDTVIAPDTAAALQLKLQSSPSIGMCGTVVRYYHDPERVQALNGMRFNVWTGQSRGLGSRQLASEPYDPLQIARATDFVLGASLAVSRAFLETIGPMETSYFLYYEEIDWATRNAGRFQTGFAHGATVWHKEGGSIGSSGQAGARSGFSDYWLTRSRLRFISIHHPVLLPWHWLLTLGIVASRLVRRQPAKAVAILRALFGVTY